MIVIKNFANIHTCAPNTGRFQGIAIFFFLRESDYMLTWTRYLKVTFWHSHKAFYSIIKHNDTTESMLLDQGHVKKVVQKYSSISINIFQRHSQPKFLGSQWARVAETIQYRPVSISSITTGRCFKSRIEHEKWTFSIAREICRVAV